MPRRKPHRHKQQESKRGRSRPRVDRALFSTIDGAAFRKQLGAGADVAGGSKELERRRHENEQGARRAA